MEAFDVNVSCDVKVIGAPISVNTIFNNQFVNQKIKDKYSSLSKSNKDRLFRNSTQKWSQSVNRYLKTYSEMKKDKCSDSKRLKTCDSIFDTSGKNQSFMHFYKKKKSAKVINKIKT